jgi:hypothetical protein
VRCETCALVRTAVSTVGDGVRLLTIAGSDSADTCAACVADDDPSSRVQQSRHRQGRSHLDPYTS